MKQSPDTVYLDGHILTMDAADRDVRAIAVRDDRILAAGSNEEIARLAGTGTETIDLQGRTVVPGFIDGHVHPTGVINAYRNWVDGRYPTTPTIAVLLEKIAQRAKQAKPGDWVLVAGTPSSDTRFAEKRLPTKQEIDAASNDAPVLFFSGMHKWVASTQGLAKLGITKGMKELKGAVIDTDEHGEPNGVLHEAMALTPGRDYGEDVLRRWYATDIPELWNSHGYTSVMAITPQNQFETIKSIAEGGGHATLRYTFAVSADPAGTLLPPSYERFRMPESADPEWYRFAGVKLWVDGDVPAKGGYTWHPYCGSERDCGVVNISPQKLAAIVANIRGQGLAAFLHATGDRATDMAIDAFEQAQGRPGPDTLQRIEHFGDFMLTRAQMDRVKRLGIHGNCQPGWIYLHAHATRQYLGDERADTLAFQFKTMLEAGLEPGFGTDLTGIIQQTENPFFHLWCLVTRSTERGTFVPEQAITVRDGLRMLTIWAARAQGEDAIKGSLEPGKLADMAVLSDDVTRIAPEKIAAVTVLETIVGGKSVYRRAGA